MQQKTVKIALVDDHTLFRNGLSSLLSEFNDIEIVFEASNGKDLQKKIVENSEVDVILMDINMPIIDGFEATAWLKNNYPFIYVLALSMFDEEATVIKMLRAGASGYVLKESTPAELRKAILGVLEKGFYSNELVSLSLYKSAKESEEIISNGKTIIFSERELTFLQYCASELTYKEIASEMNVAVRTVDNYREALFVRLQIKSRVGLVLWGIKNGAIKI